MTATAAAATTTTMLMAVKRVVTAAAVAEENRHLPSLLALIFLNHACRFANELRTNIMLIPKQVDTMMVVVNMVVTIMIYVDTEHVFECTVRMERRLGSSSAERKQMTTVEDAARSNEIRLRLLHLLCLILRPVLTSKGTTTFFPLLLLSERKGNA